MIKFLEQKHLYLNKDNVPYKSVTSVLKEFEPKKDWEKIKRNYAKKNKMSVEEVTKKWDDARDSACAKGTAYHKFRELELVSNDRVFEFGKHLQVNPSYCIGGEKHSTPTLKLEEGVYPEVILWMDSIKVAGQADRLVISNGLIHIQDYKTNKEIKREGWKNWEGKTEKLLYPLDHLDNCNFNLYSLQLSMYMYMARKHNPKLKAGSLKLFHVRFEKIGEDDIVKGIDEIKVPYLESEIHNIVITLKNGS